MLTREDYIAQNALGYEGDEFMHDELKNLCEKFKIRTIIETGTFHGATTIRLRELSDFVYTMENDKDNFIVACDSLKDRVGIQLTFGNSVDIINNSITDSVILTDERNLFFLDAHWGNYCPLLDELKALSRLRTTPVIVIHDFKNPFHPEFGYDSYNGQDYEIDWIRPAIEDIYGHDGYDYHYNSRASGAKRGVIYIYPKE